MSSAIPNARFSIGVKAPAADALRQSPSDSALEFPSSSEILKNHKIVQLVEEDVLFF